VTSTGHVIGGYDRHRYGVIVSATVDGRQRTRVGYGSPLEALREAIDKLEALGQVDEVLCISNPNTIYRDVKFSRLSVSERQNNQGLRMPEGHMLASIGRSDLFKRGGRGRASGHQTETRGKGSAPTNNGRTP
jgi:hypothetical protein